MQVDWKAVGKRIKTLRKAKSKRMLFTQHRAAKELGMTHHTYRRREQGVYPIKNQELDKLADYFDVSTNYLLGVE
jgi:transcriptional regulator with XRE-family HTH domain